MPIPSFTVSHINTCVLMFRGVAQKSASLLKSCSPLSSRPSSVPGSETRRERETSEFLSQCDVDIPAAGDLPNAEPEQADEHNAGAVQPADLQSSRLPRGGQHGAQVGDLFECFYTC